MLSNHIITTDSYQKFMFKAILSRFYDLNFIQIFNLQYDGIVPSVRQVMTWPFVLNEIIIVIWGKRLNAGICSIKFKFKANKIYWLNLFLTEREALHVVADQDSGFSGAGPDLEFNAGNSPSAASCTATFSRFLWCVP